MSGTELQVETVGFHDDQIEAVMMPNGEVYTVPKRICENIGVDWSSQRAKLSKDPIWGMVIITTPSTSGLQQTCVIPMKKIAAWLFTIQPGRVAPELKEKMRLYREECADVLDRHFRQQPVPAQVPVIDYEKMGEAMVKALRPIADKLVAHEDKIESLDERMSRVERGMDSRQPEPANYSVTVETIYGYCQRVGIETDALVRSNHTNRLKSAIVKSGLDIVPVRRAIKGKGGLLVCHWPTWVLERYFSHEKNRNYGVLNRAKISPILEPNSFLSSSKNGSH